MKVSYALSIGWRYTRANRKGAMLSFLSTISMAGLVVGVSLLITVLSVMNGFERELKERILGLLPHASVYEAGGMANWAERAKEMAEYEGVIGTAPFVTADALLSYRNKAEPALLYGVDLPSEKKISMIERFVDSAELNDFENGENSLLIGVGIANKLDLVVGAELMVISPASRAGKTANIGYFRIAGLIDSGSELDHALVLGSMSALNTLKARDSNLIDGIRLKFAQLDDAPYIAHKITRDFGPTFYQSNWQRTHGNLYQAIQVSKTMVGLLMSLIVALAAFNVVSTLIMVVVEKQSNIAILRTLGATSSSILLIFITQGVLIGAGGLLLGIILGCGFVMVLEPFVQGLERIFDMHFLHSDVYPLTSIPAEIRFDDVLQVCVVTMALVLIAALYPAWRATRFAPAQVLRHE